MGRGADQPAATCTATGHASDAIPSFDPATLTLADLPAVVAWHQRNSAALAVAVARLEREGGWALDGSLSMQAWLRSHTVLSGREAAELLRRGWFLHRFPSIGSAALGSVLSSAQVQSVQRAAPSSLHDVLHEHQAELVAALAPLDAASTEAACASWRSMAEALVNGPAPTVVEREVRWSVAGDGAGVGTFTLDPVGLAEFERAVLTASRFEGASDVRSTAARRADALVDICAHFNATHRGTGTPRHRPHVELVVDAADLGTDGPLSAMLAHGAPGAGPTRLVGAATDAFLCDCVIHRVVRSGSSVVDYGRATRSVPLPLFRTVAARDGGCRFPGCDRPVAWCDAHHVRFWRHGGSTRPDNLVLLCARHHHLVHQPGWSLRLDADATVEVVTAAGVVRRSAGRSP